MQRNRTTFPPNTQNVDLLTRRPWRTKTRLTPGEAAANEDLRRTIWHLERLNEATTPPMDVFNILLEVVIACRFRLVQDFLDSHGPHAGWNGPIHRFADPRA